MSRYLRFMSVLLGGGSIRQPKGSPVEYYDEADSRAPWSERVCDGAVLVFALWTVCCHAVVAAGGTLRTLLAVFAVAGLGAVIWKVRSGPGRTKVPVPEAAAPTLGHGRLVRGVGLLLGLAGAVSFAVSGDVLLLWWWTVILLSAAAGVAFLREEPRFSPAAASRGRETVLWVLAVAAAALTLICHRPNTDDAFYVNAAVAAADLPAWRLWSTDTLHGLVDLPLHLPVYRVHAWEPLMGALSALTGIPAIYCFHWLAAAAAAIFVPLAYARLYRILVPRVWPWAVAATLVVLVAAGDAMKWYGNFAFVRMWQGKSIFLSVLTPLIYACALCFALRPTRRGWLLLAAAQVAAVGMSSSALWAAPAAALLALATTLRPTLRSLRTVALGTLASLYTLGAGLVLKSSMERIVRATDLPARFAGAPGEGITKALELVFGDGRLLCFAILAMLTAWTVPSDGLAGRFAVVLPGLTWLGLFNPYATSWITSHLTGLSFWRALWAVPFPVLMALWLVAPLHLRTGRRRAPGRLAALGLWLGYVVLVPQWSSFSEENRARLDWPALKVPEEYYHWAARVHDAVPSGSQVIVPREVGAWLPTFHRPVHPLQVRRYLKANRGWFEESEYLDRELLRGYVSRQRRLGPDAAARFRRGLDRFEVRGVCLERSPRLAEARSILRQAGFRRAVYGGRYEIWVRGPRSSSRLVRRRLDRNVGTQPASFGVQEFR